MNLCCFLLSTNFLQKYEVFIYFCTYYVIKAKFYYSKYCTNLEKTHCPNRFTTSEGRDIQIDLKQNESKDYCLAMQIKILRHFQPKPNCYQDFLLVQQQKQVVRNSLKGNFLLPSPLSLPPHPQYYGIPTIGSLREGRLIAAQTEHL